MKRSIALLMLAFTAATAHAGSFGGPTSLNSSLDTTAEGTYQATVRARNLSGILRFAYNSNNNPVNTSTNPSAYVFFIDGMLVAGTVDAAIMSSKIAGILEGGTVAVVSPFYFDYEVPGGSFNASIDTSSANYFFKGKGSLQIFTEATAADPIVSDVRDFKISGQRTSTTLD